MELKFFHALLLSILLDAMETTPGPTGGKLAEKNDVITNLQVSFREEGRGGERGGKERERGRGEGEWREGEEREGEGYCA